MISRKEYIDNLELIRRHKNIGGDIVECGVWKGGMIAGIADIYDEQRRYILFDSFEGLPEVEEIDGQEAKDWQSNKQGSHYYNNCKADEEDAKNAMEKSKAKDITIAKGWFKNTLPNYSFENGIAILRMDADWYKSTIEILNHLFHKMNKGGIIIIDDYITWDGCAKAVHEFLISQGSTERLYQYNNSISYIIKR